jgi:hypothetical protein
MLVSRLLEEENEEYQVTQVCLEEEDGVRYHVYLQDINNMKKEDG